ncbi:hypothetical protein [Amycolatopsis saalfeldensis]|uniref:PPE family protein n=1 Tax=Amycolatopsis saalfeldensis TaxID=394193 RepID=A0A1H8YIP6_9PSEU|nr:hypothetical protein [Amycolatopsis saalfeldensis]SEP52009.1 hypothetical protein SAMN04489732_118104 [Amycolatopsis saalfeldensis]
MGNDANNNTGQLLKDGAAGAVVGGMIGGPVGAVVGGVGGVVVGGLVSMFSGGPTAQQQSANVGGQSIDAVAIYKKISTGNTSSIDGGISAAKDLETVHTDRVGKIDALNGAMDGAWQGNSAAAAQAGGHALSIWHDDSAKNLQTSHTFLGNQKDSFHTVQGQVHELPDSPPKMGFWDHAPWSDKDDEINKYNDNSKANVQAYTAYYSSSAQNAGGMPTYNVWKGNNISDGTGNPNSISGGGGGGHFGSGGGGGGGGSFNPNTKVPTFNPNVPTTPHGTLPNVPTHDPSSTNLPNFPNDHTSASSYVPPSVDPSTFNPSGFGPGGGGGAGGGFGPGGGGAGSGVGSAAFGPGGFGGGFGPGGAGSGAAAGGAGEAAGGMRGGAMGAGAAGKAGSSGMGGMGGGRGGGKKGEEDQEHQTKYLVEEDNNELFGSDQLTVPPVIGE